MPKPVIIPPLSPPPPPKGKSKAKAVTPEIEPIVPSAPPPGPPPPPGAKEAAVPAASKAAEAASSSQEPMGNWIEEAAEMAAQAAVESTVTNTKSFKRVVAEAAFRGAKSVLGVSADAVKQGADMIAEIITDIEIGIVNTAMGELNDLMQRLSGRKMTKSSLTQDDADRIVKTAYDKAWDAVERSVNAHARKRNVDIMEVARLAYRAGIVAAEKELKGVPRDIIFDVLHELEPAIREHATKITTVRVVETWDETRVRSNVEAYQS